MPLKTKSGRVNQRGIIITLNAENTAKFRAFEKRIGKIKDMDAFVEHVANDAVSSYFGAPEIIDQWFVDFVGLNPR